MKKKRKLFGHFQRLATLYSRMDAAYDETTQGLDFTCADCPNNCCVSYFQHHTYIEWAYLWKGLRQLREKDEARIQRYLERAEAYVVSARNALSQGLRPTAMCPLNDDGRCGVYDFRLMICRMHGTANILRRPDGTGQRFPGCFRYEEAVQGMENVPCLDRTPLYAELARLEMDYLGGRIRQIPRVDLTLAEMLVQGPPKLG